MNTALRQSYDNFTVLGGSIILLHVSGENVIIV